jgi:ankyrin repeat protein
MHFMAGSRVPWLEIHDALPQNGDGPPFGERDAEWRTMEQQRALLAAIAAGDEAAVEAMLAIDAALARTRDAQGVSAICRAVYAGHDGIARRLAAGRSDLDVFEAAVLGEVGRVRELVAAEPGLRDAYAPDGFHPLGYACFFGRRELFDLLLACGADVSAPARNPMQVRPLHSAAAHADPELALYLTEALLAAGASPNVVQQGGFTPLHEASLRGHVEMVGVLLQHGADAAARNADGRTPADLARDRGVTDVLSLLARKR